ncbi:MAG TPA: hypothetical protein VMK12_13370 [Anaeromyxobacteraceae bacterium]|nr:hypothetical protein [Anaeromyxobacteraceae bacterium]
MTLKRLDQAFQAFFRRAYDGEAPLVPAPKGARALQRLGVQDAWRRLATGEGGRHGRLRVAGVELVKTRGKPRNEGEPKTREIVHRRGRSHASVTVECTPKRCHSQQGAGLGCRDPCHARH